MITRAQMETDHSDFAGQPLVTQLERITAEHDEVLAGLAEGGDLAKARDATDRLTYFTEQTAYALDGDDRIFWLVASHRRACRIRSSWDDVEASAELRRWVVRDVRAEQSDVAALARQEKGGAVPDG